mgnify:FL=1
MIIFNVILVFVCWGWARGAFEEGNDTLGWFHIFCSAFNAAAAANVLLR